VFGPYAALVHALTGERTTLIDAPDESLEPVKLEGAELFDGHVIGGADRMDGGVQIMRILV
jgi:hypothetical protein